MVMMGWGIDVLTGVGIGVGRGVDVGVGVGVMVGVGVGVGVIVGVGVGVGAMVGVGVGVVVGVGVGVIVGVGVGVGTLQLWLNKNFVESRRGASLCMPGKITMCVTTAFTGKVWDCSLPVTVERVRVEPSAKYTTAWVGSLNVVSQSMAVKLTKKTGVAKLTWAEVFGLVT